MTLDSITGLINIVNSFADSADKTSMLNQLAVTMALATTYQLHPNGDLSQTRHMNNTKSIVDASQQALNVAQNSSIGLRLNRALAYYTQRANDAYL